MLNSIDHAASFAAAMSSPPATPPPTSAPSKPIRATADHCDKEESFVRSHLPPYFPNREIDLYVHKKANFSDLVRRCEHLLSSCGHIAIFVHAVGQSSIPVAINLAQQVKENVEQSSVSKENSWTKVQLETFSQAVDISGT